MPPSTDLLQQAIAAIKAGDKATGQQLLLDYLKTNPRSETALLWLSATTDNPAQKRMCLEKVLAINPNNENARRGLAQLQPAAAALPPPSVPPVELPPLSALTEFESPPVKVEELPAPIKSPDLQNTKQCPYCAETIKVEAKVCRFCGRDLTGKQSDRQAEAAPTATKSKKPNPIAVVILAVIICFGLYLLCSVFIRLPQSQSESPNPSSDEYQLELLSSSLAEASKSYLRTEGQVKNISNQSMENVQVVVQYFDADDNFITSDSAIIEYNPILPGQTSPFQVTTSKNPKIKLYSISFKTFFGGTIRTKDSRK